MKVKIGGLLIIANRDAYSTSQIKDTMTVGELIEALKNYDEDDRVYLCHDNGYTYRGIQYRSFIEYDEMEDGDGDI